MNGSYINLYTVCIKQTDTVIAKNPISHQSPVGHPAALGMQQQVQPRPQQQPIVMTTRVM